MKPPSVYAAALSRRLPPRSAGLDRVRPKPRRTEDPVDVFRRGLRQAAGRAYLAFLAREAENR